MKIEAGKYYKTRDGRKVGPMRSFCTDDFDYDAEHETDDRRQAWWKPDGMRGGETEFGHPLDLIAEWTDTPKLWRDMTPAEKGALLLAHHEGKVIEASVSPSNWISLAEPSWGIDTAYRVKPADPVVETVTIGGFEWNCEWHFRSNKDARQNWRITFNLIDGKPDCDSIRMEEL